MADTSQLARALVPVSSGEVNASGGGGVHIYRPATAPRQIIGVRLFWNGGPQLDPQEQAGLSSATIRALTLQPVRGRPLAERLAALGIKLAAGAAAAAVFVELAGRRDAVREGMRLIVEVLHDGLLSQEAFDAGRSAALFEASRRAQDSFPRAVDALRSIRSAGCPALARPPEGLPATLRAITLDDARAVSGRLAGAPLHAIVAGDDDREGIADDLRRLFTRRIADESATLPVSTGATAAGTTALVRLDPHRVGQAYLLWGNQVALSSPADLAALEIAMHALVGWTGSRWWTQFRDRKGHTYGIASKVELSRVDGRSFALAYVGMAVASQTVSEVRDELLGSAAELPDTLGPTDLLTAANQLLRNETFFHLTMPSLLEHTARHLMGGFPATFGADRVHALRILEPDEVLRRFKAMLDDPALVMIAQEVP